MALICCFCSQENPDRAKFCNECGSPAGTRPCRQCDAVNLRGADRCHQCGTMFESLAEPEPVIPTDSERIIAQAGDKLAALQRDLALATASAQQAAAPSPSPAPSPLPESKSTVPRTPVEAVAAITIDPPEPEGPPPSVIGERRPGASADDIAVWFDPTAATTGHRWHERPRRGRRVMVAVLALAFFVAPAAVWTYRHPEQVHAWRDRLTGLLQAAMPRSEPVQQSSDGAPAEAVATSETPAATDAAAPIGPAADRGSTTDASPPRDEPVVSEAAPAPPAATTAPETRTRARTAARSRPGNRAPARRTQ